MENNTCVSCGKASVCKFKDQFLEQHKKFQATKYEDAPFQIIFTCTQYTTDMMYRLDSTLNNR